MKAVGQQQTASGFLSPTGGLTAYPAVHDPQDVLFYVGKDTF